MFAYCLKSFAAKSYFVAKRLSTTLNPIQDGGQKGPLCITASRNILASGNLCFRVFKLQLKVVNKNVCYLYSV